jgi:hypothetical protein
MMFRILAFLFFMEFSRTELFAAPPMDLTREDKQSTTAPARLTEKDITFVGPDSAQTPRSVTMKFNVFARSLPKLDSKRLFRILPGTKLKPVQMSKDQRWVAIESLELQRKGWVPLKALEVPDGFVESLNAGSSKSFP